RQKPQDFLLSAVEQEARLERPLHHRLAGHSELGSDHQSLASHLADDPQLALQLFQLPAKIDAHLAHAVEEAGPLDDLEELQGEAALTGPPPNVVPCIPGDKAWATASRAMSAASGRPAARGFATRTTSGRRPYFWNAKNRPVRPNPHWISSAMNNAPVERQSSWAAFKNSSPIGTTPPSPWMVSISTAATRGEKLSRR